jgi:hypothetical protein
MPPARMNANQTDGDYNSEKFELLDDDANNEPGDADGHEETPETKGNTRPADIAPTTRVRPS